MQLAESARASVRRGQALNSGLLRERTQESKASAALDNLATATQTRCLVEIFEGHRLFDRPSRWREA